MVLLRRSVELARASAEGLATEGRPPLVAASVGPYGAVLADGSEYDGRYGMTTEELVAFHQPRLDVLLGADRICSPSRRFRRSSRPRRSCVCSTRAPRLAPG